MRHNQLITVSKQRRYRLINWVKQGALRRTKVDVRSISFVCYCMKNTVPCPELFHATWQRSKIGCSDDKWNFQLISDFPQCLKRWWWMIYFLSKAPTLDENASRENRTAFANLVSLFTELVRHDVFSHDAYICTLIARGDLVSGGCYGAIPIYQVTSSPRSEVRAVCDR